MYFSNIAHALSFIRASIFFLFFFYFNKRQLGAFLGGSFENDSLKESVWSPDVRLCSPGLPFCASDSQPWHNVLLWAAVWHGQVSGIIKSPCERAAYGLVANVKTVGFALYWFSDTISPINSAENLRRQTFLPASLRIIQFLASAHLGSLSYTTL